MPLLEVSLPLDPFLSPSHWAWLFALCLATLATFSRLSPFSFFMDSPPISSFISSRHVRLRLQQLAPSSKDKLSASKSNEAVCSEVQAGSEKDNPWRALHLQQCGAGEEDEVEEEEEMRVSSLLEASRSYVDASKNHLEASRAAVEEHRACTSCVHATSWSHSLHRQISARAGIQWHCRETRVGTPLHHQARLPCVAEVLCTQNVSKMWACQELQRLQCLQVPNKLTTIPALEVGIYDGFAHLGYHDGEIALWDVEKRVHWNRLRNRERSIAALFTVPLYPRVAIATRQSVHNQMRSIVSVWDDRCALQCASFAVSMRVSQIKVVECKPHELGIAGEGYVSRFDLRMLKGNPILIYAAEPARKLAWGGQGRNMRGPNHEGDEVKSVQDGGEEEVAEFVVKDNKFSNYYDGNHVSSKRRCSFLFSCLSFMCCLAQNP